MEANDNIRRTAMFEFTYDEITSEQRDAYLERIGCAGLSGVTKENLDKLVYEHQCHVPFEAFDCVAGMPEILLDRDTLFHKIVENRRGGFCFELNGMFVLLLRSLGFDAYSCVCRVAATRDVLGGLTHRGTIVRLDGRKYIVDVGLGGPMAPFAVELSEEKQTQYGETYWVEPTNEGWFLLRRLTNEGTVGNSIIFGTQAFLPTDFVPLCRNLTASKESRFRTVRMANLRRPNGYLNLMENILKISENGETREVPVTDEEYPAVLKDYFGLVL